MSFQGGFGSKPSAAIATGVRVVATDTSRHGHYSTGDTGVICRLNPNDPVVRWDRSGQEHQTSHGKLASGVAAAAWLAQLARAGQCTAGPARDRHLGRDAHSSSFPPTQGRILPKNHPPK